MRNYTYKQLLQKNIYCAFTYGFRCHDYYNGEFSLILFDLSNDFYKMERGGCKKYLVLYIDRKEMLFMNVEYGEKTWITFLD